MTKTAISLFMKKTFLFLGIYALLRKFKPNRKVAILRYHAVVNPRENFYTSPGIALSPAQFARHVRYFARRYRVMSLDAVIDCFQQKRRLPKNAVVFTFDDGYADNFAAAKMLAKYGASGTFYITTNPISRECRLWLAEVTYLLLKTKRESFKLEHDGAERTFPLNGTLSRWQAIREIVKVVKSNDRQVREKVLQQVNDQLAEATLLKSVDDIVLTWEQLRQMRNMGMVIGSHTTTHLNLPNAAREDARQEINQARSILEEQLNTSIRHFSYPNSGPYDYYNEEIRQMVIDAGYDSSSTSGQGFADGNSDFFALERIRTVPELAEVVHSIEWDRLFG